MIALTILALILGFVAYVYRLNRTLATTPPEAKKLAIPTLTDEVIRKTYQRIQKDPIPWEKALPKRLDRRYIVVGGSGRSTMMDTFRSLDSQLWQVWSVGN